MSSYRTMRDPCRIVDTDSEDERDPVIRFSSVNTSRIPTAKIIQRIPPPKITDWDTSSDMTQPQVTSSGRISSSSSGSSFGVNKPQILPTTTAILESPQASTNDIDNLSNFNPVMLVQEDINKFIYTPIPKDYPYFVRCCIKRDKIGIQGGSFPSFYLQLECLNDSKKHMLLAARKVAKINRQSEYIITTNIETLSKQSSSDGYVGKLCEQNLSGTEYILYDNGVHPKKFSHKNSNDRDNVRRELAAVIYNANLFGFKGPRQISVMLPELGHDIQPLKNEDGILDQWRKRRFSYLTQLRNKMPRFNEATKTYVLQFSENRVAQPSVKNFQMIIEKENHEELVMQFGRVDKDTFTCDYRYPLSPIQAFGIALSSFDSRIIRE